jgi:hypothetical protein
MKNIFFLPTDQPSSLGYHFDKVSSLNSVDYAPNFGFDEFNTKNNYQHRPYHLYITSDEEINKDSWVIKDNKLMYLVFLKVNSSQSRKGALKIILTTDATLIADGIQAIDDEFLEWFVKNPSCEFVKTELLDVSEVLWEEYFKKHGVYPKYPWYEKIIIPQEEPKYVSSGGAKYVFGTVKGEYTIGNPSPNTAKGEFALAMGYNPETTNRAEGHHSIVIGNGLTSTKPYQLLVDRNGVKIDKIMTIEEYELLSQVLKSINDIKI